MDIQNIHFEIPKIHGQVLTIITILCSTLSCICIIFTLIALRFVKIIKKNREKSTTKDLTIITTHLCICLLASLIVFLLGILIQYLRLKVYLYLFYYIYNQSICAYKFI